MTDFVGGVYGLNVPKSAVESLNIPLIGKYVCVCVCARVWVWVNVHVCLFIYWFLFVHKCLYLCHHQSFTTYRLLGIVFSGDKL
jgi:fatty acid desaturase